MQIKLSKNCDKSHKHHHLLGGRARGAACFPLPLIKAILSPIQATRDADPNEARSMTERVQVIQAITHAAGTVPMDLDDAPVPTSSVRSVSEGALPIGYQQQNVCTRYIGEYTGEVLDPIFVQAAIGEELDYFNERVWEVESKDAMQQIYGHVHVRSRWVLCNKGNALHPNIRARLVACEVNKNGKQDSFFASTPPLEAKKLLFAQFARERRRQGEPLQLCFVGIEKAYFNGIPKKPVYIQFPKELGLPNRLVGKLVRCAYGTRDAGAIWEDTYRGALE